MRTAFTADCVHCRLCSVCALCSERSESNAPQVQLRARVPSARYVKPPAAGQPTAQLHNCTTGQLAGWPRLGGAHTRRTSADARSPGRPQVTNRFWRKRRQQINRRASWTFGGRKQMKCVACCCPKAPTHTHTTGNCPNGTQTGHHIRPSPRPQLALRTTGPKDNSNSRQLASSPGTLSPP